MKIREISKIAKETGYNYYEYRHAHSSVIDPGYSRYLFKKEITDGKNTIIVDKKDVNRIWFQTDYCDEKDITMIKAAIKLAETPIDER